MKKLTVKAAGYTDDSLTDALLDVVKRIKAGESIGKAQCTVAGEVLTEYTYEIKK